MTCESAHRRWVVRSVGLLMVCGGAACALFWLWTGAGVESRPVEPAATAQLVVSVHPADARVVCRDLVLKHSGDQSESPAPQNVAHSPIVPAGADNLSDSSIDFVRDIRPLLVDRCYRCHGPDRQEAGLRFDLREAVFRPAASGATPVLSGDPVHSEMLTRILATDDSIRMPADAPPLAPLDVVRLRQWIAGGAPWPEDAQHWSFVRPRAVLPPETVDNGWSRGPIDDFVSARRENMGLPWSAEADRVTQIRRLSLDLIGLPPTPEEVDRFEADHAPDAYERLVDRLLSSPHFGEKWAIRWLDLARYADTNGFEFDAQRTIWLYRDWVVAALNGDMPFDQFTVEQLAGDLLPGATTPQRVATGFLRNSAVAPDTLTHRFEMLVDRVNTVGAAWLGLTFQCAQCHDHKFDPLTQQEYYRLYAVLNNVVEEVSGLAYEGSTLTTHSPLTGESATTLVLEERREPMVTHLKVRGSAFVDGEQVEPGLPEFLHPSRCGTGDRLALACWLVDESNPLTARVVVNRIWEDLFGTGLVRTSDDFGLRGELPSHPQLLDWLAVEFQRSGWSTKHIVRQIVCSAAYRQSSHRSPGMQDDDPQNRWLARGPRFRVSAEVLRDIVLSASGLLSTKLGGPSVFPRQPPGTSENVEFAAFPWIVSDGEDRFRRGLYSHWKRRTLYPSFAIFDAPSRTSTCTRRDRTTNPLQALVVLNDPVFVEAAVHLGRRMLDESDGSPAAAVTRGVRLCIGRRPSEHELQLLLDLQAEEFVRMTDDVEAACAFLGKAALDQYPDSDVAGWAAYAAVANVLLSLDETITRE